MSLASRRQCHTVLVIGLAAGGVEWSLCATRGMSYDGPRYVIGLVVRSAFK